MQGEKNLPKNKLNLVLPLSFLIGYYVYESIIFATNKNRSMPNDNIAHPTPNEPLEIGAKKSKKRLDKLVWEVENLVWKLLKSLMQSKCSMIA